MALDPIMEGYTPLIITEGIVHEPQDFSPRIRGVVPGKQEQEISIHPDNSIDFGSTDDSGSLFHQVLIVNRGYKEVTIDSIEVVGDFVIQPPQNMTIQPGDVISFGVKFTPSRNGPATGAIYVTAGNATGERFLKLLGNGN